MKMMIAIALTCLLLNVSLECQDDPNPTMSDEPLTTEQLAIYQVVIRTYRKRDSRAMNLANRTDPLQRTEGSSDLGCVQGIKPGSPRVVHRISDATALGPALLLIDPDRQQEQINRNDPQNFIKRAIDKHQKVTNQELDDSIKKAFETGLFTLSEIAFDKNHRYAVVAYSFVCGGLCGNGETLVLRKVGQTWKVTKHCGGWVS